MHEGEVMNDRTKLAKSYMKGIATKQEFKDLIGKLLLSDSEVYVLTEIYLHNKQLSIIADDLGYSVQTVKRIHRDVLTTVSNYIYDTTR